MAKIKIYLHGTVLCSFFNCQSISAEIEDERRTYIAHFGAEDNEESEHTESEVCADGCYNSVTLYSDKSLASFKASYREKFSKALTEKTFSCCFKNCSDSVNFVLDFFFPGQEPTLINKHNIDKCCSCGKAICGCGIPGLLVGCLPPPPYMNTPQFVFNKALLLARSYGKPIKDKEQASSLGPLAQQMSH